MIEFILLAFLYAKFKKKYKLKPIFSDLEIYIPLLFALLYIFLEITIWCKWYAFVPYAQMFKTATLLSYLPMAIKYKLYEPVTNKIKNEWIGLLLSPIVIAVSCIVIGTVLNIIAVSHNSGYMPVFPSLTISTGYITKESFVDGLHVLGGFNTKMIPLTDWIDTGIYVASPGDIFVRMYPLILIFFSIKYKNNVDKSRAV